MSVYLQFLALLGKVKHSKAAEIVDDDRICDLLIEINRGRTVDNDVKFLYQHLPVSITQL